MEGEYDIGFKFIIIGDAGTGKSCLLRRFIEDKFYDDTTHTVGVEFGTTIVELAWDTAGSERFRTLTQSYYRDAVGVILVYDITNRDSFNSITHWIADARQRVHPQACCIILGNKVDMEDDRDVPFLEGARFAQENEIPFLETSALTGDKVDEAFLKCARSILTKIEEDVIRPETYGSGISVQPSFLSAHDMEELPPDDTVPITLHDPKPSRNGGLCEGC
ncbi:Rab4 [Monocercomonoides exilis]|uniref:Rab4 n=1 Tax=Monocercomonoides exilis TaxID=2049356 RepID=UPI0035596CA0|nr:Rab4 [Monocercomonoides exilis]